MLVQLKFVISACFDIVFCFFRFFFFSRKLL